MSRRRPLRERNIVSAGRGVPHINLPSLRSGPAIFTPVVKPHVKPNLHLAPAVVKRSGTDTVIILEPYRLLKLSQHKKSNS